MVAAAEFADGTVAYTEAAIAAFWAERDECPHHSHTDWSAVLPGWECPYGCGAFVRDDEPHGRP